MQGLTLDVKIRRNLTSKVGPRAERVNYFLQNKKIGMELSEILVYATNMQELKKLTSYKHSLFISWWLTLRVVAISQKGFDRILNGSCDLSSIPIFIFSCREPMISFWMQSSRRSKSVPPTSIFWKKPIKVNILKTYRVMLTLITYLCQYCWCQYSERKHINILFWNLCTEITY